MTPDIHTKTYAERSGLGGIASGLSAHGMSGKGVGQGYGNNLHQSAKNQKGQQQLMGLTVGGSGINTSSMIGVATNNSNMGMYNAEADKGNGPQG